MNKKVAARILLGTLALSGSVILFQNCGGFDVSHPPSSAQAVFAIKANDATSANILTLVNNPSSLVEGSAFTVTADLSSFASDTQFLWDHDFSNGLTYCELTTSVDKTTTSFSCPGSGVVTVDLTAYNSDGTTQPFSMQVTIGTATTTVTATPTPGAGSTPTPTPTPVTLSADAMLFNTTCSGCHGTLPNLTDKKGTTLSQLQNALATVPAMNFLNPMSATEEAEIISALN
jgi:hypothetical protein